MADCNNEIHENDVGTEFIVTIVECDASGVETPIDISSASNMEIVFLKADATKDTFAASFVTDGLDGEMHYFTLAGDLTPAGNYKLQGIVTTPAGKWYSTREKFKVVPNL